MAATRAEPMSPLRRILANTAWLLGGKTFGAVLSLIYLAILTRTLGLKGFGHFSLIFGTAQALIAFAGFQSWRVVVRYGAPHVHAGDWRRFGRVAMLCGVFDVAGALLGCVIAYVVLFHGQSLVHVNPKYVEPAFWFCCAMLWASANAAIGVVRALDRFDVAVYVEAVVPAGRLVAAVAIAATGPSVVKFLIGWAVVDLIEAALYWATARRLCPEGLRLKYLGHWRETFHDNPGIGRFLGVTYTAATLEAAMKNGPLLVVGALVGTRAAGLYRLAAQLGQAMSKLSTLLARTVYAEINRARVSSAAAEFRKLAFQTSAIAAGAGALVVMLAVTGGRFLLTLLGGEEFAGGVAILIPLTVAASFDLASVAFEPVLHSTGLARYALLARAAAVAALIVAVFALLPHGAVGIATAVAIGGAVSYVALGGFARATLNHMDRADG